MYAKFSGQEDFNHHVGRVVTLPAANGRIGVSLHGAVWEDPEKPVSQLFVGTDSNIPLLRPILCQSRIVVTGISNQQGILNCDYDPGLTLASGPKASMAKV